MGYRQIGIGTLLLIELGAQVTRTTPSPEEKKSRTQKRQNVVIIADYIPPLQRR